MIATRTLTALLALGITLGAFTGCSSDDDGGSSSGAPTFPEDTSAQGIGDFLAAESYKQAPWISEDAAPRPAATTISPHGSVRTYRNPTLQDSIDAGDGLINGQPGTTGEPIDQFSMVVKEMFDESGALIGKAANLKADAGENWTFFCYAPGEICGSGSGGPTAENPAYGFGADAPGGCAFCHADEVLSPPHR